ncbi:transposase, IS407 family [Bordetella holmesii CDC-H785-BH]|nr:transposase, IS407 family [Bordetella holmesii CDC-H785-BH]KCV08476.1 transposase, IS407 family [Bordetella holmesii CDC-H785-BH]KCV11870.1 transposase, IS407 family [Bordetella holmesii CDC-H785-BH]KCV12227.1 transposase, IS407 family [Bordetella holmesii CDC-H785-BH]KCV12369.1 transposase, IS407 family [Bordetella holmesii CDC-H785-BH]
MTIVDDYTPNAWPSRSIRRCRDCVLPWCCNGWRDAWPAAIYYRGQRARVRRKSLGRLGAYQAGVKLSFIRPGKPVENAYIESFNGKFRDECLNEHWFLSLRQAKSLIENWRVEYNTDRPHSALGYLTPAQFVQAHQKEGLLPLGSMSVPY